MILRTVDGGATWAVSSTGASLSSVSFADVSIGVVVGNDSDVEFSASALPHGWGVIYRTTNGGLSWVVQHSPASTMFNAVWLIDADTRTIVGREGTILRTTDGGDL